MSRLRERLTSWTAGGYLSLGAMLFVIALLVSGCTDPKTAERALRSAGYKNIEAGGYSWFGCSEGDVFRTRFRAVGPTGVPTEGAVCNGWFFRGAVIRVD